MWCTQGSLGDLPCCSLGKVGLEYNFSSYFEWSLHNRLDDLNYYLKNCLCLTPNVKGLGGTPKDQVGPNDMCARSQLSQRLLYGTLSSGEWLSTRKSMFLN